MKPLHKVTAEPRMANKGYTWKAGKEKKGKYVIIPAIIYLRILPSICIILFPKTKNQKKSSIWYKIVIPRRSYGDDIVYIRTAWSPNQALAKLALLLASIWVLGICRAATVRAIGNIGMILLAWKKVRPTKFKLVCFKGEKVSGCLWSQAASHCIKRCVPIGYPYSPDS